MRYIVLSSLLIFTAIFSSAQSSKRQSDWQQKVDYNIDVSLDDVQHLLKGNARYKYTNNSPNELTELHFHIWPNAYKDNKTDFARQFLLNGNTSFHFAEEDERGYINGLKFSVDGKEASWKYYGDQIDVCVITLNNPIQPGETAEIETPFEVKIPGSFSRCGHDGQSYQITQWYPKPAVYDVNGWNPMPYLNQGEFYSEYGRFEVRITLPENYVVAATGELQEASEKKFLEDRMDHPYTADTTPPSAAKTKTITFIQDNIHDFAWFADKRFNVRSENVTLSNDQLVETYVYAVGTDLNYNKHIKSALNYYSDHCGYYPYKSCSVVEGALKAGGGMEYPMITVVTELQEEVIVHEVGHNWFYGILGNNERLYPWMDESINSYFEHETMHPRRLTAPVELYEKQAPFKEGINSAIMTLGARQMEAIEYHQPIGLRSEDFSNNNYGFMVYGKGAEVFGYLRDYLGQDVTNECFRAYFDKWKFRHPLPKDMQAVFEETSARNLDWFFNGVINSDEHIDYRMKLAGDGNIVVENLGGIDAPYAIGFFKDGRMIKEMWVDGHPSEKQIVTAGIDFDVAKIDPREVIPEFNRQNNSIRQVGAFKKIEPIRLKAFGILDNPNYTTFSTTPVLGYNVHNKLMLGLWFNNVRVPTKPFVFSVLPMFSTATNDLNGYFDINYTKYRNARLDGINFGVRGSRFAFDMGDQTYNRIVPFVKFHMRHPDKKQPITSSITLRSVLISNQANFDLNQEIQSLASDSGFALGRRQVMEDLPDQFYEFIFERTNNTALKQSSAKLRFQLGMPQSASHRYDTLSGQIMETTSSDMFAKVDLELKRRIDYKMKKKGLDIRIFGGVFLDPADNGLYQYRVESSAGRWDYTYDEVLMGRGAASGVFSQQVIENDVFIKDQGSFVNMDQWALSVNLKSDLPLKLPVGVYLDAFTFNDIKNAPNVEEGESFIYSGGMMVKIVPKYFEIYFPLFNSKMISEAQSLQGIDSYGKQISFMLNLDLFGDKSIQEALKKPRG